jgi:hypothetical protein
MVAAAPECPPAGFATCMRDPASAERFPHGRLRPSIPSDLIRQFFPELRESAAAGQHA